MSQTSSNRSHIAANPAVMAQYGAIFDFHRDKMDAYPLTFVLSDREHKILRESNVSGSTPDAEIRSLMGRLFPEAPIDRVFANKDDYGVLRDALVMSREKYMPNSRYLTVGASVLALEVGAPEGRLRIGMMNLPENFKVTPDYITTIPAARAANPTDPGGLHISQQDFKALVVTHEVHHLLDHTRNNSFSISVDPNASLRGPSQQREVIADRGAIADAPALISAGLLSGYNAVADMVAARRYESFQNIVRAQLTAHFDPADNRTHQRVTLMDNDTGFALGSASSLIEQERHARINGTEIRTLYDTTLGRMFEEAIDGKSGDKAAAAYRSAQIQADDTIRRHVTNPGAPGDLSYRDRLVRAYFDEAMLDDMEFVRDLAAQTRRMPSLPRESVVMAMDFVMAYDRLVKPPEPPPALEKRPEAAPKPQPAVLPS